MIVINKREATQIRARYPDVVVTRVNRQSPGRYRAYMSEEPYALDFIEKYRLSPMKFDRELQDGKIKTPKRTGIHLQPSERWDYFNC